MAQETFVQCNVTMIGQKYLLTEPKHLTEDNAWVKDYDWRTNADESHHYYYLNKITREQRPMTEQQYNDDSYTLNTN